jgi:hypothetical protein
MTRNKKAVDVAEVSSMTAQLLRHFLVPVPLLLWSLAGAQQPIPPDADDVPLPADEVRQITTSLLERYPELASSPGVKVAAAPDSEDLGTSDATVVVFYPHTQSRGINEALVAYCGRTHPEKIWTCDNVEFRRYAQLASQDYEVRVRGEISSEAALALIEASRRDLQAAASDRADLPKTAVMVQAQKNDRYFVTWGTPEGISKVVMRGELALDGDPANPDDWRASIFQ